jgi:N-acetylneuraminic acid mutarotase
VGSLNTARWNHTATLLANGQVLVTGGSDANGTLLASAELYDPATGTWSLTGSLAKPHVGHFAFALASGAVLVLDGDRTSELYDPATGTWRPAGNGGPMGWIEAATMLQTGKILALNGMAWFYDPIQQSWDQASGYQGNRQFPDATLLPGGKVLVVGGTNDPDGVVIVPGAELYDPTNGASTMTGTPNVLRQAGTDTLLPDGSVLAAGGYSWVTEADQMCGVNCTITYPVPWRSSESYDADGIWRPASDLNEPRSSHTATLLRDGRVLIVGGEGTPDPELGTYSGRVLKSAELYDPTAAAWTYTSSPSGARARHTATLLDDGSVLVVGGWRGDSSSGHAICGDAEVYIPGVASE